MNNRKGQAEIKVALAVVFGIIFLIALTGCFYTISAGERGVLLTFGKPSMESIGEGLHFKYPVAQTVKRYNVKTQLLQLEADSVSFDLQQVTTIVALNYRPNYSKIPMIHTEIGQDYENLRIVPLLQQATKSVTAMYKADELTKNRMKIAEEVKEILIVKLASFDIIVEELNIINFRFSDEFNVATEQRAKAEQDKQKAEMDLERIKIEKEQKITQAEAEAQSIKIQSEALKANEDILELRAIEKWDGKMPLVTGGSTPFVSLDSLKTTE